MCRVGSTKAASEDGGCRDQEEKAKSGHTCLTPTARVPFPAMGVGAVATFDRPLAFRTPRLFERTRTGSEAARFDPGVVGSAREEIGWR
jgi:hypothetical protein